MANLICRLKGVRGRSMRLYDNKVEITTDVTWGSVLTRNSTDGIKTIFFIDCVGVQFKESATSLGYLQFETASSQMNNVSSNQFSENTFTFDNEPNYVTNALMSEVHRYVLDRIEGYKYNDEDLLNRDLPDSLKKLYGSSRPLNKKELIEAEEMKKQNKEEKRRHAEEALAARKKFLEETVVHEGDLPDLIQKFIRQVQDCSRYGELKAAWYHLQLNTFESLQDITKAIATKEEGERLFGSDAESVQKSVNELCAVLVDIATKQLKTEI